MAYFYTIRDMRNANDLDTWVAGVTGEDSWRTVAEKLHTTHSTIKRRLTNHEADAIVEVARAYDTNPISGLLAAGIITELDVKAAARTYTVDDLSDVEIAQIIVDRLEAAERNSNSNVPVNWQDYAVADSSPDHPEEDTDFD